MYLTELNFQTVGLAKAWQTRLKSHRQFGKVWETAGWLAGAGWLVTGSSFQAVLPMHLFALVPALAAWLDVPQQTTLWLGGNQPRPAGPTGSGSLCGREPVVTSSNQ